MSEFSADERIKLQRQCVDEHIGSENEGKWAAVYDTFVDSANAFYDVIPLSTTFHGRDGVRGFYEFVQSAFPDLHFLVTGEYDVPGCSVRECTATGTHRGEYCGVAPSGRQMAVELAVLFLFEDEDPAKLVAERVYFDNETLLRQLRGEADAPVGVGLAGRDRSNASPNAG
jgi:predicted ester cyclase